MSFDAYSEIACAHAGCGEIIVLHDALERKLRHTHESFFCPSGHSNYFPGKTAEEKRIEELEAKIRRLNWRLEMSDDRMERMRKAAGVCPWVGCNFRTDHVRWQWNSWMRAPLWTHMRAAHGMPTIAEIMDEAERAADGGSAAETA